MKFTAAENVSWLEGEGGELEGKTLGKPAPHKSDGGMSGMVAAGAWLRALGSKSGDHSPVRMVMSHPGLALDTGMIPKWAKPIARLALGGHSAAEACLGNVAALACPAAKIPQGSIVGPMDFMQGPPGVSDLTEAEGPGQTWKIFSGTSGVRLGELVLDEVARKTRTSI